MGNPPSGLSPLSIPSLFFFPPLSVPSLFFFPLLSVLSVPLCFKTFLKHRGTKSTEFPTRAFTQTPRIHSGLGCPFCIFPPISPSLIPSLYLPLPIPSLCFFPPLSVLSVPLCFKTLKTQRHKVHRVSYKSLYPNPENPFRFGVPFLYLFPYLPLSNSLPL